MHQAMRQTKRTIAVLSPEYLEARFTLPEWAEAFRRDPTGEYALLVPVRVNHCEVDGVLGAMVYIDLVGLMTAAAASGWWSRLAWRPASRCARPVAPAKGTAVCASAGDRASGPAARRLAGWARRGAGGVDGEAARGRRDGRLCAAGHGRHGQDGAGRRGGGAAGRRPERFPGGAAWIACEGLEGEAGLAEVWARVARALGHEQVAALADAQARRAALAAALAQQKRLLLALDNVEPGLDADALLETLAVRGHTALLLTARQQIAPHRLRAIALAAAAAARGRKPLQGAPGAQIDAARPNAAGRASHPQAAGGGGRAAAGD